MATSDTSTSVFVRRWYKLSVFEWKPLPCQLLRRLTLESASSVSTPSTLPREEFGEVVALGGRRWDSDHGRRAAKG